MKTIKDKYLKIRIQKKEKRIKALITRRFMTSISTQFISRKVLSSHLFRLAGNGKLYYLALDKKKVLSKGIFILHPSDSDHGDFTAAIYGRNYLFGISKKLYKNIEVGDKVKIKK